MNANTTPGRKRRQNEKLAEDIFGRGRRATPTGPAGRNQITSPSLASRAGIAKVKDLLLIVLKLGVDPRLRLRSVQPRILRNLVTLGML